MLQFQTLVSSDCFTCTLLQSNEGKIGFLGGIQESVEDFSHAFLILSHVRTKFF